jgi:hypothetical protein
MLRVLVVLLLLANGAYFAWSQDVLQGLGLGPARQSEPQRIAGQISADSVRVLTPDEARQEEASLAIQASRKECLTAGPFSPAEAEQLEQRLRSLLPAGAYVISATTEAAQWMVYMGPYATAEMVARKQAELRALGVKSEPAPGAAFQLGLSLGLAASESEGQDKLKALAPRGVRTARLVQEKPETTVRNLRLPAADEAQRRRVEEALSVVPGGKPPRLC